MLNFNLSIVLYLKRVRKRKIKRIKKDSTLEKSQNISNRRRKMCQLIVKM